MDSIPLPDMGKKQEQPDIRFSGFEDASGILRWAALDLAIA